MPGRRFHTVDVFARDRYAGNQLAVVHDAADLDDETLLALTRETNYSEAAFLEDASPEDGRYPVRIFDPAEELPFAGHPTLGTAAVIREFVREDSPDELVLALPVGDVRVWVETDADGTDRYWMDQVAPAFDEGLDRDAAAAVLGLDRTDVLDAPLDVVSTGLPTLAVPLRDLDAAERAATQPDAYDREVVDRLGGVNVLVVAPETVDGDAALHVRVFADWAGVPEDPATGSAAGCLAAYLARYDDVARRMGLDVPEGGCERDDGRERGEDDRERGDDRERDDGRDAVDCVVEQGIEMNRPSRLHLRASVRDEERSDEDESDDAPSVDVRVGGRVVPVAEGHLL